MLSNRHAFKKILKVEVMGFVHVSLCKRKVTVPGSNLVCVNSDLEIYTLCPLI